MKFRPALHHPATAYVLHSALIFLGYGLSATTYVPFLLEHGLTMAQVPLINVFFFGTLTLMELPTGMWADGRSRLRSVRLGTAISSISMFGCVTIFGFWSAVCWEMLGGLANAFLSGANTAWLTDSLERRGERDSLRSVLGTVSAAGVVAMLVGGVVGAFLGTVSFTLVWAMAGLCHAAALLVSVVLMSDVGEPDQRLTETQAFAASFRALNLTPGLRWAMTAGVIFSLVLPYNYYWSPFFAAQVGLANLGWIWAVTIGAGALGGLLIKFLKPRQASDGWLISACLLLTGAGLAAVGQSGLAAAVAFAMLHEVGRAAFNPLVDTYVQGRIESQYRATFGSLQSFISRGGYALTLFGVWAFTRRASDGVAVIPGVWLICGSLMFASAALLWLFRPR